MNELADLTKAIYFDNDGKPHDAFLQSKPSGAKNSANILYHPKIARRFWNLQTETRKKWIEVKNVVEKEFGEKIIHIEKDHDGLPMENVIGIKNCYKIVNG